MRFVSKNYVFLFKNLLFISSKNTWLYVPMKYATFFVQELVCLQELKNIIEINYVSYRIIQNIYIHQ